MERTRVEGRMDASTLLRDHILHNISRGQWTPGTRLPPERELATRFGMARNTLRKVLTELEMGGYLVREIGRGTFVCANPSEAVADGLFKRMLGASPTDVIELRMLLEPPVAALAAARATADELTEMERLLERGEAAGSISDFEHWDAQLHLAIFRAARNQLLADYCDAINQIRNQPLWFSMKKRSHSPTRRTVYLEQHRKIVVCLRERDAAGASEALTEHLQTIRANMLEHTV